MIKKIVIINLFLIPIYFLLFSCFEPEEGCLDIEANNFQLAADRDCSKDASDNCFCTYPSVSLKITHVFDKIDFSPNQIYRTNSGEYIRIQDIQFYMSDIQLVLEDNSIVQTLDTITLTVQENGQLQNQVLLDDFHLVNSTTQTINSLVTTNQSGTFSQLQFSIGVKSPANTTNPDQLNQSTHVLSIDSMYIEQEGYIFNRISIQPDTSSAETWLFQFTQADSLSRITCDIPHLPQKQQGKDISIETLQINHAKWFDGINFAENSQSDIRRKIVTNTTNVFTILQ